MSNNLPEGWRETTLGKILEESDFARVYDLINQDDWVGLKKYLNSIKDKLLKQQILPDYLYLILEKQLKGGSV